jgi:NitT/TauT family transport system ATP-binding protein
VLDIQHVSKSFGRVAQPVLDDFSLTAAEGEFVSLIGPSGCGKTTLLRIVAGLLPATSGDVSVAGVPSVGPSRDKAVVFQHFNLFPWRTTLANAAYGLEIQKISKQEREERAMRWLRMLGLEKYAHHYPGEISGGMRQRVGIARALAIEPKLLLMDEPFGALDEMTRERLNGELLTIWRETGTTIVFVTHSIAEAVFLSTRVVVMSPRPGRIAHVVPVDLPYPRDVDTRELPHYFELISEVREYLRESH